LSLAIVRDLREVRVPAGPDELAAFETDVLAGFVLAWAAAGLSDNTIRSDVLHLEQLRAWFGGPLWDMEPADADVYFGRVLRDAAKGTRLARSQALKTYFLFLPVNAAKSPPAPAAGHSAPRAAKSTTRLRCAMHWPDPAQRPRIAEIRDNLTARIAEAEREGWLGEAEGPENQPRRSRRQALPDRPPDPSCRRHRPRHARSRPASLTINRKSDLGY
jgi:hypothetical protein